MMLGKLDARPAPSRGRHVLVAEDDPVQNKLANLALVHEGYRVTTARTGAEALRLLRVDRPDAILSDIQMPEMDGLTLCQTLRSDPSTATIPVVLVSSYYLEAADHELAAEAGAWALVGRTPSLEDALRAVFGALESFRPSSPPPDAAAFDAARAVRGARALDRSAAANVEMGRRLMGNAALLAAVSAISDTVGRESSLEPALQGALRTILELTGVSRGALYLTGDDGRLNRAANHGFTTETMPAVLSRQGAPLRRVLRSRETLAVSTVVALGEECAVVDTSLACRLILAPLICRGASVGFLALGVDPEQATREQWLSFARTIGVGLGQAIGLERASARLLIADERHEALLAATLDAATERQKLVEQLLQSQKMEATGRMSVSIAHDLNNLLSVVLAHAGFLVEDMAVTDPHREDAESIKAATDRAAVLSRHLTSFARRQTIETRPIDLNTTVAGMQPMLGRLLRGDIQLTTVLAPDLPQVLADPGQLERVLLNLAINARDAMPEGGTLVIETAELDLAKSLVEGRAIEAGAYVLLTVTDTGTGMDADTRGRAFEPFFTTKDSGRGTGLGLWTCHEIIRQCGGHLFVESEPGHGTTFKAYLPRL